MSGTVLCNAYGDYCRDSGLFVGGGESDASSQIIGAADTVVSSFMNSLAGVNEELSKILNSSSLETRDKLKSVSNKLSSLTLAALNKTTNTGVKYADLLASKMKRSVHPSFASFVGGDETSPIFGYGEYVLQTVEFVGGESKELTESVKVRIKVFEQYLNLLSKLNSAASGDKSKAELKRVIREQKEFLDKAITEFKRIVALLGPGSDIGKKLEELSRSGDLVSIKKILKDKQVNDDLVKAYLDLLRIESHVVVRAEDLSKALKEIGMTKAKFDGLTSFDMIEDAFREYETKIVGRHGKDKIKFIEALEEVRNFAQQHVAGEKYEGACPCNEPAEFYPAEAAESYFGGGFLELEKEVSLELRAQAYQDSFDPIKRHFIDEQSKVLAEMAKAAKASAIELASKPIQDDLDILNFLQRLKSLAVFPTEEMINIFASRDIDHNSMSIKHAIISGVEDLIGASKAIEGKVPSIRNFVKCAEAYKEFLDKYYKESKSNPGTVYGGVNCSGVSQSSVYERFEESSPISDTLFVGGLIDITLDDIITTFSKSITLGRMQNGLNLSLQDLDGFSLEQDKINADVLSKETNKIMDSVLEMVTNYEERKNFPIKKNLFETVLRDNARGQIMLRHAAQAMDKKMRFYQRKIIKNPELAQTIVDLLKHTTIDPDWLADPEFTELKEFCNLFHVESVATNTNVTTVLAGNDYRTEAANSPFPTHNIVTLSSHVSTLVAATKDKRFDEKYRKEFKAQKYNAVAGGAAIPGLADQPLQYSNYYGGDKLVPFKINFDDWANKHSQVVAEPTNAAIVAGQVPEVKFLEEHMINKNYRDALTHQRKGVDSVLMLRNLFSIFDHIDTAYRKTAGDEKDDVKIGQIYSAFKEYLVLTSMYPTVYEANGKYTCGHICMRRFGHDIVVPFEQGVLHTFEEPRQMDLMELLSVRKISLREYYNGVDVQSTLLAPNVPILPKTGDYTDGAFATMDKGVGKSYSHSKKHNLAARYSEHDILAVLMLKSMFAKIMSTAAQLNLITLNGTNQGTLSNLDYHKLRTIYGGDVMSNLNFTMTPEVRPECAELYLRLKDYIDFYKNLFLEETTPTGGVRNVIEQITALKRIALLPTSNSKFGSIMKIFFLKGFQRTANTISDPDLSNYVAECNKLYDAETGSEKVRMEKIIKEFVADVNHRYGLVKTDDFVDVMQKKRDASFPTEKRLRSREEYNANHEPLRGKARLYMKSKPLLDGEDRPIGDLHAPSAAKEVGNNVISSSMSLIKPDKSEYVMTDLMAAIYSFRTKLDRLLKGVTDQFENDQTNNPTTAINNSLFRHIIYLKTKLSSRNNNLDRFRILKEYISSDAEDKVHLVNRDVMLYRDLVVNGCNLLFKIYTRVMATVNVFGRDVEYADPLNRGSYLYYLDSVNTDLVTVNRLGKTPELDFSNLQLIANSFLEQTREFHLMLRSSVEAGCADTVDKHLTLLVNIHRSLFKDDGLIKGIDYANVMLAPINDFSEFLHASYFESLAGQNSFLLNNEFGIYDSPMSVKDPRINVITDLAVPNLEFELLSKRFAPRNIYQLFEYLLVAMYKIFYEQNGVFYGPLMNDFVVNTPSVGFNIMDKLSELGGIEDFEKDMPVSKKAIALYKMVYGFTTTKKDTLIQNDYTLLPETLKASMKKLLPIFMFYFKFIIKHSYLQLGMLNDGQVIANNAGVNYKTGGDFVALAAKPDDVNYILGGAADFNSLNQLSFERFKNNNLKELIKLSDNLVTSNISGSALSFSGIKIGNETYAGKDLTGAKMALLLDSQRPGDALNNSKNDKTMLKSSIKGLSSISEIGKFKEGLKKVYEESGKLLSGNSFPLNDFDVSPEMSDFVTSFNKFLDSDFYGKAMKDDFVNKLKESIISSTSDLGPLVDTLLGEGGMSPDQLGTFSTIDFIGKVTKFTAEISKVAAGNKREIYEFSAESLRYFGKTGCAAVNTALQLIDDANIANVIIYALENKATEIFASARTPNKDKLFMRFLDDDTYTEIYNLIKSASGRLTVNGINANKELLSDPNVLRLANSLEDFVNKGLADGKILLNLPIAATAYNIAYTVPKALLNFLKSRYSSAYKNNGLNGIIASLSADSGVNNFINSAAAARPPQRPVILMDAELILISTQITAQVNAKDFQISYAPGGLGALINAAIAVPGAGRAPPPFVIQGLSVDGITKYLHLRLATVLLAEARNTVFGTHLPFFNTMSGLLVASNTILKKYYGTIPGGAVIPGNMPDFETLLTDVLAEADNAGQRRLVEGTNLFIAEFAIVTKLVNLVRDKIEADSVVIGSSNKMKSVNELYDAADLCPPFSNIIVDSVLSGIGNIITPIPAANLAAVVNGVAFNPDIIDTVLTSCNTNLFKRLTNHINDDLKELLTELGAIVARMTAPITGVVFPLAAIANRNRIVAKVNAPNTLDEADCRDLLAAIALGEASAVTVVEQVFKEFRAISISIINKKRLPIMPDDALNFQVANYLTNLPNIVNVGAQVAAFNDRTNAANFDSNIDNGDINRYLLDLDMREVDVGFVNVLIANNTLASVDSTELLTDGLRSVYATIQAVRNGGNKIKLGFRHGASAVLAVRANARYVDAAGLQVSIAARELSANLFDFDAAGVVINNGKVLRALNEILAKLTEESAALADINKARISAAWILVLIVVRALNSNASSLNNKVAKVLSEINKDRLVTILNDARAKIFAAVDLSEVINAKADIKQDLLQFAADVNMLPTDFFPDVANMHGVGFRSSTGKYDSVFMGGDVTAGDLNFIGIIYNKIRELDIYRYSSDLISSNIAQIILSHKVLSETMDISASITDTLMMYAIMYELTKKYNGATSTAIRAVKENLAKVYNSVLLESEVRKILEMLDTGVKTDVFVSSNVVAVNRRNPYPSKGRLNFTPGGPLGTPVSVVQVTGTTPSFDDNGVPGNPTNANFHEDGFSIEDCKSRAKNAIKLGTLIYKSLAKVYTEIGDTPKYLSFTPFISDVYEVINAEKNISPLSVAVDQIPTFINSVVDDNEANIIKTFTDIEKRKPLGIHSNNINDFTNLLIDGRSGIFTGLSIFLHDDKMHTITLNDFPYFKKLISENAMTESIRSGFSNALIEKHIHNFGKLTKYLYELEFKDMANTFPVFNNLDSPKFMVATQTNAAYTDQAVTEYKSVIHTRSLMNSLAISLAYRGRSDGVADSDMLNRPVVNAAGLEGMEILEAYMRGAGLLLGETFVLPPETIVPILELGSNTRDTINYITCNNLIKNYSAIAAPLARNTDRIIKNIIDLGIMPININAMMREIPLANTFNNNYTFDILADWLLGADTEDAGAAAIAGVGAVDDQFNIPRNVPINPLRKMNINKMKNMFRNPLGEVFVCSAVNSDSTYRYHDTITDVSSFTSAIVPFNVDGVGSVGMFAPGAAGYLYPKLHDHCDSKLTEYYVRRTDANDKSYFKLRTPVGGIVANQAVLFAANPYRVYKASDAAANAKYHTSETYKGLGEFLSVDNYGKYNIVRKLSGHKDPRLASGHVVGAGAAAPNYDNLASTEAHSVLPYTGDGNPVEENSYYANQSVSGLTYGNIHDGVDPDLRNPVLAVNIYSEMLHSVFKKRFKDQFESPDYNKNRLESEFVTGIATLYTPSPLN
jgi:hypothetical protein